LSEKFGLAPSQRLLRGDIFHTGGIGWDQNTKVALIVKGQGKWTET